MVSRPRSGNRIGKTLWQALLLRADVYAEAFRSSTLKRTAQTLVGVAAFSHAVGSGIILLTYNTSMRLQALTFLANSLSIVVGYYIWTVTIGQIGAWLQAPMPPYKRLLNPIGLAYAPQVFNVFTVVPLLGRPIEIGLALWSLVAATVALHKGVELKLGKAIAICTGGWVVVQVAIGVIQIWIQSLLE